MSCLLPSQKWSRHRREFGGIHDLSRRCFGFSLSHRLGGFVGGLSRAGRPRLCLAHPRRELQSLPCGAGGTGLPPGEPGSAAGITGSCLRGCAPPPRIVRRERNSFC